MRKHTLYSNLRQAAFSVLLQLHKIISADSCALGFTSKDKGSRFFLSATPSARRHCKNAATSVTSFRPAGQPNRGC